MKLRKIYFNKSYIRQQTIFMSSALRHFNKNLCNQILVQVIFQREIFSTVYNLHFAVIMRTCYENFHDKTYTNAKVSVGRLATSSFPRVPVKHGFYYSKRI